MLIMRARLSSSATDCRIVLQEATAEIRPKPKSASSGNPTQNERVREKATSARPATMVAAATKRPSPRTELRVASMTNPATAPKPTEPIRNPRVRESPENISLAKIGISVEQGALK